MLTQQYIWTIMYTALVHCILTPKEFSRYASNRERSILPGLLVCMSRTGRLPRVGRCAQESIGNAVAGQVSVCIAGRRAAHYTSELHRGDRRGLLRAPVNRRQVALASCSFVDDRRTVMRQRVLTHGPRAGVVARGSLLRSADACMLIVLLSVVGAFICREGVFPMQPGI